VVLAPIWLVFAGRLFFWLHRAGRVRLAVSVSGTLMVLVTALTTISFANPAGGMLRHY
jgi:hypothetical protein